VAEAGKDDGGQPAPVRGSGTRLASPRSIALGGLVLAALIGVLVGAGGYTFVYAKGGSYLTDDPRACANCHIMQGQYDGWMQSSHHHVATCNDCHTPEHIIAKYFTKANNGLHHSIAFTSGNFHEPIHIKKRNLAITEERCRDCHAAVVEAMVAGAPGEEPVSCVRCHADVGHRH